METRTEIQTSDPNASTTYVETFSNEAIDRTKMSKANWIKNNRGKVALAARTYYQKKVEEDPAFRQLLSERTKQRRLRLNGDAEPKPKGRPRKPKPEVEPPKKTTGRPRKYV
jgi:hypothetical protein